MTALKKKNKESETVTMSFEFERHTFNAMQEMADEFCNGDLDVFCRFAINTCSPVDHFKYYYGQQYKKMSSYKMAKDLAFIVK